MKKAKGRLLSLLLCASMVIGLFTGLTVSASAADEELLTGLTTYSNNGYTFEKVSHYNAGTETADGIVDYTSPLQITANTDGNNDSADSVQSYTYCAVSYGDWVYMGTMYGALSAYTQVESAVKNYGASAEVATAVVDAMFNGKLNKGKESDGYPAGSVFFKFNIKTGETKILMSRTMYNQGLCDGVPIFRSACEYNGKLYFVGLISDGKALAGQSIYGQSVPDNPAIAINYEINMQSGIPCVYEVDPENDDKLVKVTQCVTKDGYLALNARYAFTSTRAINTFTATKADGTTEEWLLAGGLSDTTKGETYGATIMAAYQPSAVEADYEETDLDVLHGDFKTIADQNDLYNYPAITRTDSEGGGGLYQIIQYGENTIYTAIVTGKKADGTKEQCYAIVKGVYDPEKGEVNDADAWTWTPVVGDLADGATYTFGIDPSRTAAGACTLQVYGGYLYIGEYNDVNYSLTNVLTDRSFRVLSKNLTQSINLYRMDEAEDVELVVGDTTDMFPTSVTGIGSGYESHMNQYTWMTTVVGDTMYLSTMDETSLTHVIAQLVNGELLNMSDEEWESQLNYLLTLVDLLNGNDEASLTADGTFTQAEALAQVEAAVEETNAAITERLEAEAPEMADQGYQVELTDEQKNELVEGLSLGEIQIGSMDDDTGDTLNDINMEITDLAAMLDDTTSQEFIELYAEILQQIQDYVDGNENISEDARSIYDLLFTFSTAENLEYLSTCLSYMEDSVAGFDLYAIKQDADGDVTVTTVSNDGFGDRYNHGLRIFAETNDYLAVGTANPFYGAQIWRMALDQETEDHDHSWDAGTVTTEPGCLTEGVMTYTCTICGETKTEAIPASGSPFVDVQNPSRYYYTPVLWAVDAGITNGTSATTFSPDANCTREQVVTFLWRAAGSPEPTITGEDTGFTDLPKSTSSYYKAILWGYETGIVKGTSSTTFGYKQTVSRAQFVTFLWRYAGEPEPTITGEETGFTDLPKSTSSYYKAILWACENGITNGDGAANTFKPKEACTRGQVVTFLYRYFYEGEGKTE